MGLTLGLQSTSFASAYMSLYTKAVAKSEVQNEINGGNVEKDFTSFYISTKEASTEVSSGANQGSEDKDSYIVFGVEIPLNTRS